MSDASLRQRRGGLSLRTVADRIGITPQMLGAIERGIRTCNRSSVLENFWPIIFHRTIVLV